MINEGDIFEIPLPKVRIARCWVTLVTEEFPHVPKKAPDVYLGVFGKSRPPLRITTRRLPWPWSGANGLSRAFQRMPTRGSLRRFCSWSWNNRLRIQTLL